MNGRVHVDNYMYYQEHAPGITLSVPTVACTCTNVMIFSLSVLMMASLTKQSQQITHQQLLVYRTMGTTKKKNTVGSSRTIRGNIFSELFRTGGCSDN